MRQQHSGAEEGLFDALETRLSEVGIDASLRPPGSGDGGLDAVLEVRTPTGVHGYGVQVKTRVSPGSAVGIGGGGQLAPLIVAPYVQESTANAFRLANVEFVDSAGNMWLRGQGMHIDIRGRRRPKNVRTDKDRALRSFKPSGLKVLFALMCEPGLLQAPYRTIAEHSGVSLGTVQLVVHELETAAYVETARHERRMHRMHELFDRWVTAYALDLWPKLTMARFDAPQTASWRRADEVLRAEGAWWGGETAAARLGQHLRPGRTVVYASGVPQKLVMKHRLRKASGEGNVEFRRQFWNFSWPSSKLTVPTPLVYADLVASGDPRLLEAAGDLRESDELLRRIDRR